MKILTLNTHSIIEDDYEIKLRYFVDVISEIKPQIICLQEVNQTMDKNNPLKITEDNHSKRVCDMLLSKGIKYNHEYLPIKNAYKNYVEGVSILSKDEIADKKTVLLSKTDGFKNWKKRMALGVKTAAGTWFYSCHFGWFDDEDEPFINQWNNLKNSISDDDTVFLLGDFNSDSSIIGEGYDLVIKDGFFDTYYLAYKKDDGFTAEGEIWGWEGNKKKKRIDYIFSNKPIEIEKSEVIFNDKNYKRVSDHFGILVTIKEG